MKLKRIYILGIYDMLMALGAVYLGAMMVKGNGIFSEYPREWLDRIPFKDWVGLGIVGMAVFGLGNSIAAVLALKKQASRPWLMSGIMGMIFLISIIYQRIMLGEWYLATSQFLIFSLVQIALSGYGLMGYNRGSHRPPLEKL